MSKKTMKYSRHIRKIRVILENVQRMEAHQKLALAKRGARRILNLHRKEAEALSLACRNALVSSSVSIKLPSHLCLATSFLELDASQIHACDEVATGKYTIWSGLTVDLLQVNSNQLSALGGEAKNAFLELHHLPYVAICDRARGTQWTGKLLAAWVEIAHDPAGWETLRAAMRGFAMLRALQSLRLAGDGSSQTTGLSELIRVHRDHVKKRVEWHMNHNHVLFELALVPLFSHALGDPSAAEEGLLFERELIKQTDPDGYHCELSSMYHFEMTLMAALYAAHRGGSPEFLKRFRQMVHHLRSLLRVDPDLPVIGDSFRDNFLNITGKHVLQIADWLEGGIDSDSLPPTAKWVVQGGSPISILGEGLPDFENPTDFAGHHLFKTETGAEVCFVCGPVAYFPKAGHAHPHMLQVLLTHGDELVFLDPGTYSYDGKLARKYFTATRAHNTIEVGGISQFDRDGAWNVTRLGSARLIATSATDGRIAWVGEFTNEYPGIGTVVHRRLVAAGGDALVVLDAITSQVPCSKIATWQLGQTIGVADSTSSECSLAIANRRFRFLTGGDADGMRVKRGWFSPDRGVRLRPWKLGIKSGVETRTVFAMGLLPEEMPGGLESAITVLVPPHLASLLEI